jgi:two-component system, cell cycle sensor histidine kinase and response regulator CckA
MPQRDWDPGPKQKSPRAPIERALSRLGSRSVNRARPAQVQPGANLAAPKRPLWVALDFSPDSIFIVDSAGRFLDFNVSACNRLSYKREELLAMTLADIEPADAPILVPARVAMMMGGPTTFESNLRGRDGVVVPVEIIARSFSLAGNLAIVIYARDITDRKEAEANHAAISARLREAERMEAVGRLAGGIAHDFNNLAIAIHGYATLALAELPSGDGSTVDAERIREVRADLESITTASDRVFGVTRSLLAFSRRQVLQPSTVDLAEIVRRLEPMLGRVIGDDKELVTVIEKDGCCVFADQAQIEQVIVNLVVNARDAMPDGGTLTIEVDRRGLPQTDISPEAAPAAPVVTLAVRDTGSGISPSELPHIFEPFFTTKAPGKGTGLGLATVHGIVKQSGGTITVASELGRGSTFTISLPAVVMTPDQLGPARAETVPREARSETILVAQKDPALRALVSRVLAQAGYRVLQAAGGADAVRIGQSEAVDLLLTEAVLPELSGPQVASQLTSLKPGLRVLVMSGGPEMASVWEGVLGPDARLLAKPFTPAELLEAVHAALAT